MDYRTSIIEEKVGDQVFRLHCISDIDSAIDQMFDELNARGAPDLLEELCPYFGSVWPSARALTHWMWEKGSRTFSGTQVLELGCGLALPSFVALRLGAAKVIATDLHPDVPVFLARNQLLNGEERIECRLFDWRDLKHPLSTKKHDWILGSDILYEPHHAANLADFLKTSLHFGGKAVIVDPNRTYWESLVARASERGLKVEVETLPPTDAAQAKAPVLMVFTKN